MDEVNILMFDRYILEKKPKMEPKVVTEWKLAADSWNVQPMKEEEKKRRSCTIS